MSTIAGPAPLSPVHVLFMCTCADPAAISAGLKPGQATNVGVYTQNSVEWVLTEQGCYTFSMVLVPLYDTLGEEACTYIINQVPGDRESCRKTGLTECS